MTRKDYRLIAQAVKQGFQDLEGSSLKLSDGQKNILVDHLCWNLARENGRFDRFKFSEAIKT